MKALKNLLLLLLLLSLIAVIGFCIYVAVQPNSFKVTRTKTINAPQSVVYNNVIDFKNWESWSSWIEENPETTITLPEQTKGIGGSYSWVDDNGAGTMKTTEASPHKTIEQEMQFEDMPTSNVNWIFEPLDESKTEVTWTITGEDLPFKFKMFSAIMGGMEKQIGPHYERGLEKLDSVVQAEMKVYSIDIEGATQHSGGYYLYNTTSSKFSEFEKNMKEMMPKVGGYAISHNITMAGKPFVLYHKWDEENDAVIFSCCVPTNSKIISNDPHILTGQLPSFRAVKTVLKGDYSNLKEAWERTMSYIKENGLEMVEAGAMLETYVLDATQNPNPAKWLTEIYVEVK